MNHGRARVSKYRFQIPVDRGHGYQVEIDPDVLRMRL